MNKITSDQQSTNRKIGSSCNSREWGGPIHHQFGQKKRDVYFSTQNQKYFSE
jgi:hypothetical protein